MVVLHTPHGKFDTTLFAIAERIPERLLARCSETPPLADESIEGFPFVCDLTLGSLGVYEREALNLIVTKAISKLPKPAHDDMMIDVLKTGNEDPNPTCSLRIYMRHHTFTKNDARDLKLQIIQLREDLLDTKNYSSVELSHLDEIRSYFERSFTKDEKFYSRILELLLKSYGKHKSMAYNGLDNEKHDLMVVDQEAFKEMAHMETYGPKRTGATSTKQRFD